MNVCIREAPRPRSLVICYGVGGSGCGEGNDSFYTLPVWKHLQIITNYKARTSLMSSTVLNRHLLGMALKLMGLEFVILEQITRAQIGVTADNNI